MCKQMRILFVDDDPEIRDELVKLMDGEIIEDYTLKCQSAEGFEDGITKIRENSYEIIVLDLCKGKPLSGGDQTGLEVLRDIQKIAFIPVIFYSGLAGDIRELESDIVRIVSKTDGSDALKSEIEKLTKRRLPVLRDAIHQHIDSELKSYFWDIIHKERKLFNSSENDYSLGYLLLRRIADSLSKTKIKTIIGDSSVKQELAHPMEVYIYPVTDGEFEVGEIVCTEDEYFVLLTPSCDYIERFKKGQSRGRKAKKVLLVKAVLLKELDVYKEYESNPSETRKGKLLDIIQNKHSDQFFFLPKTPFIENCVIDFQEKKMVKYEELQKFKRIAKLDDPYAEAMTATFIRYYNRVGCPDIDVEYILKTL